jgi:hypothetical protein
MPARQRPSVAASTGQNVGTRPPDLAVVHEPPHPHPDPEAHLPNLTGSAYLEAALERNDLQALREIAAAAGDLVDAGMPTQTEEQMRAASALQRAVLNLPR